ncbi:hypothetical protein AT726_08545 [Turicibacter sp. H121]|nr:hypothetical protein AT726_08545 [Turicibacter sp. H121]
MSILSSSNVLVTNLEQNQIESQQLMNVLISTEENETQISFLNKESNDDTPSNQKQESQELHKVNSSSEVSDIPRIEEDEAKKKAALANLQAALSESQNEDLEENPQQEVSNQAFKLSSSGDEIVKVIPLSTISNSDSKVDETETVFKDYRQTFYSVTGGEVKVGYGLTYQDDSVKVIDNVMHYYDAQYEWLPIVAINIDEVLEVGLNERGIPNYYGTVLEITYPEGDTQKAIVLDACGACSWDNRIDLWVYDHDYQHDIKGIEYRIVREGFKDDKEQS